MEFPVSPVLESGMSSLNSCGHIKVDPQPGDLYIFARPRHWWEPTSGNDSYTKYPKRLSEVAFLNGGHAEQFGDFY